MKAKNHNGNGKVGQTPFKMDANLKVIILNIVCQAYNLLYLWIKKLNERCNYFTFHTFCFPTLNKPT